MILELSPAVSLHSSSPLSRLLPSTGRMCSCVPQARRFCVKATIVPEKTGSQTLSGVLFEPFKEVKDHLSKIPQNSSQSLARQNFADALEAAINEQINIEYNTSYVYHALFAYFDRDNVALPGFAKFFKESSDEERKHAVKLMEYQNTRGGKVKLQSIVMPSVTEFDDEEKGDALCAMEITLALEKLVLEKLLQLQKVAVKYNDPQLQDYVESEFLKEQVEDVKKIAEYVAQLRQVGKGHGVYHFDLKLQGKVA